MAEPAPIYDPDKKEPVTRPDLRVLEGGGKTSPPTGNLSAAPEPADLAKKEKVPTDPHQVGRGYTGPSKQQARKWLFNKRRKALGGGIIGTIIALLLFFTFASGPLQLIHLAQILQKNFYGSENTSAIRSKGLFRYARTGDIGETRLNKLGSIVYRKTLSQLKDIGIEFQRNSLGSPKSMTIELSKNPDYKGMSRAQVNDAVIKDFKITDNHIVTRVGDIVTVHIDNTNLKGLDFAKSLARTAVGKLDKGKLATAMGFRYLKTAWNLPRLFDPIQKRITVTKNQVVSVAETRKAEKERVKANQIPETAKTTGAKSKVKGALKDNQGKIGLALLGTTLLCVVRGVADDVVTVNRAEIVLPAAVQAIDKIAIGSKVQSGQNFDIGQLGAVVASFKDENGKTIWDSKALQATAGQTNPTGQDLPADYAQAFSNKTTAASIKSAISVKVAGVDFTGLACSPLGLTIQLAAGVAVAVSTIPTGGGSTGAWIATQTAIAAGSAGAIYLLHQQLHNLIDDKAIVPDELSGPLGGNLLAYGARETANIGARASGGVELSGSETAMLDKQQQVQDQQQFHSKSLISQLFDVQDSRSFASKFIGKTSPSPTQNLASVASFLTNFRGLASNLASVFTPKAQAASQPYDWGFPRYGIPQSVAEDPKYEDPYANAEAAVGLLKSDGSYKDRVEKCFGVTVNEEDGWSVTAESEVNPADSSYINANCSDNSDNWHRIQLFVFDSRLMDSTACYEGDEAICSELGFGSSTPPSGSGSSEGGAIDQGTNAELAQKILDYKKTGQYNCDNSGDCTDLQKVVKGQSLAGSDGCVAQTLDPRVLQLILYTIESGNFRVGTYALCGDHSSDSPRGHSGGFAVDFSSVNGTAIVARSSSARSSTLALATFLHGLSGQLAPRQLITAGYGGQFDQALLDLEIPSSATFGGRGGTNSDHTNHIHVGY